MRVLVDTNAYSGLLRGNNSVLERLDNSENIYMSIIVIAELLTGFKGGNKEMLNIELLNDFLSNPKVSTINATMKTATIFSEMKHYLWLKGLPIPINDVWIAAHAYEYDAELITFDKHFKNIPKLKLWSELK